MSDDIKNDAVQEEEDGRDVFGIISIVLVAAALFLGTLPVIGTPLRVIAGALAAIIGVVGVIQGKRANRKVVVSVVGIVIGAVFLAWTLLGFPAIESLVSSLFAQS